MCLVLESNHEWSRMVGNILSGWSSNPRLPLQYCQEKVDRQSLVRLLTLGGKSDTLSQANRALVKPGGAGVLNFSLLCTHLDCLSNWSYSSTGFGYVAVFCLFVFLLKHTLFLVCVEHQNKGLCITNLIKSQWPLFSLSCHQLSFHWFCICMNLLAVKLWRAFLLLDLSRETVLSTVTCTIVSVQWCKPSNRTTVWTRKISPVINLSEMRQNFSKVTNRQVAKEMVRIWTLQLKVASPKSQFLN